MNNYNMNLSPLVRKAYNRLLRPHLPRKLASLNGVPVRYVKLLDQQDVFPNYESALLSGIRRYLAEDAETVIVGGGQGVSAVVAARRMRENGEVVVFEGSADQVDRVNETVDINGVGDLVKVHHAVVGEPVSVWGDYENAKRVEGGNVPDCDALILDCEGAETNVLIGLTHRPELLIVETHAYLGAPEEEVREIMEDMDYEVVSRYIENDDRGIVILVARQEP